MKPEHRAAMGLQPGERLWFIGGSEVVLRSGSGASGCKVEVLAGDPERLRAAAVAAIKARPEGFVGGPFGPALGGEGVRDTYCADVRGRHLAVVLSTRAGPSGRFPAIQASALQNQTSCVAAVRPN